jgi:hypothetical protein
MKIQLIERNDERDEYYFVDDEGKRTYLGYTDYDEHGSKGRNVVQCILRHLAEAAGLQIDELAGEVDEG